MYIIYIALISLQLIIWPSNYDSANEINDKTYGREYFPQNKKSRIIYDSNLGETVMESSSKENKSIYSYDTGKIKYKQHFKFTQNGVYLTKTESKALFFGNMMYYKKPILRLPFPLKIGMKWNWNGYEYKSEEDSLKLKYFGEVIAEENIVVPAGKFTALKIKTTITNYEGKVEHLTEWYAPNVGLIKMEAVGKGSGVSGIVRKLFGMETIKFELKEIKG